MTFSERLKKRRNELGLTQDEVAEFFDDPDTMNDLSRQSISKWERGEMPSVKNLLILSVKLDIPLDELFADELNEIKRGEGDSFKGIDPKVISDGKRFAGKIQKKF